MSQVKSNQTNFASSRADSHVGFRAKISGGDQPDIKGPLKRAFICTAAAIVVSVIALCFEQQLSACTAYAVAALCLGVAGLVRWVQRDRAHGARWPPRDVLG